MAYRFTNTDKWSDAWFSNLKPMEKLLFNYLCDNCDIGGFIEINIKHWASFIGSDSRTIEGALKGLARGLIYSNTNDCIYLRTFLKHQKNLPLNELNKAHIGILKRFNLYSHKFDIQNINEFISRGLQGACKGDQSPTGIGIGNGIDNDKGLNEEQRLNILREKAKKFKEEVLSFKNQYSEEMLIAFWKYWIEPNKSKTKLKYEIEETWDLKLRIDRWSKNNKKPLSSFAQAAKHDSDY